MKSNKAVLREAIKMMIREGNTPLLNEALPVTPDQTVSHMQEVKSFLVSNQPEIRKILDIVDIPAMGAEMLSGKLGLGYYASLRSLLNGIAKIDQKNFTDLPYGIIVLSAVFSRADYDNTMFSLRVLIDTLSGKTGVPIFEARGELIKDLTKAGTRLWAFYRMRGVDQKIAKFAEDYILNNMNRRQINAALEGGIDDIADLEKEGGWTVASKGGNLTEKKLRDAIRQNVYHNVEFDDILEDLESEGTDLTLLRSMLGSDPPTYANVFEIVDSVNVPGGDDFIQLALERIDSVVDNDKIIADIFAGITRKGGLIAKRFSTGARASVPRGSLLLKIAGGSAMLDLANDLVSTPSIPEEAMQIVEDSAGNHEGDIRVLASIFRDYMEDTVAATSLDEVAEQVKMSTSAGLSPGLPGAVEAVVAATRRA